MDLLIWHGTKQVSEIWIRSHCAFCLTILLLSAAITLRHLVHTKHTASFHFGCKKCGSHFTTAEHLAMHGAHSTCNEEMVWPTTVAPGSKCVTREEAAQLEAAEAAGVSEKAAKAAGSSKENQAKEASKAVAAQDEEVPSKRYAQFPHSCAMLLSISHKAGKCS